MSCVKALFLFSYIRGERPYWTALKLYALKLHGQGCQYVLLSFNLLSLYLGSCIVPCLAQETMILRRKSASDVGYLFLTLSLFLSWPLPLLFLRHSLELYRLAAPSRLSSTHLLIPPRELAKFNILRTNPHQMTEWMMLESFRNPGTTWKLMITRRSKDPSVTGVRTCAWRQYRK